MANRKQYLMLFFEVLRIYNFKLRFRHLFAKPVFDLQNSDHIYQKYRWMFLPSLKRTTYSNFLSTKRILTQTVSAKKTLPSIVTLNVVAEEEIPDYITADGPSL